MIGVKGGELEVWGVSLEQTKLLESPHTRETKLKILPSGYGEWLHTGTLW